MIERSVIKPNHNSDESVTTEFTCTHAITYCRELPRKSDFKKKKKERSLAPQPPNERNYRTSSGRACDQLNVFVSVGVIISCETERARVGSDSWLGPEDTHTHTHTCARATSFPAHSALNNNNNNNN